MGYTQDLTILVEAFFRIIIFTGVAGVVTFLAVTNKRVVEKEHQLTEFQEDIITNAQVWLSVLDTKGTILVWNTAAEDISGYQSEEVIRKNEIWKLLYPDPEYRRQITSTITRIIGEKKYLESFETSIHTKQGTVRTISWNTKGVPDENGIISSFIAIGVDVTDQKQAETELRFSEEKFAAAFTASPNPITITDVENGTILDVNLAFEEWSGYVREEIISRRIQDLHIWTYPEERDSYIRKTRDGEEVEKKEVVLTTKRGDNRDILFSARVIQVGNRKYMLSLAEDVTEHNKIEKERVKLYNELLESNEQSQAANEELLAAEEELKYQYNTLASSEESLRETKEYLESLISIANVPILIWNSSFQITRINRATEILTGYSADEVLGKSLDVLFPPSLRERSMRLIQTTLDGVRWETVELEILHRDGTVRTVIWNSSTLYSSDGVTPVATIAQGQDITTQRQLEKEKDAALIQIQQNLAQLAILNDGIRNPLTIILTCAEMLDDSSAKQLISTYIKQIDEMVDELDKRWINSEKVLSIIRKHYQINPSPLTGQKSPVLKHKEGSCDETDLVLGKKNTILVEEAQAALFTILDSMDAMVYVADMNTHELLFVNQRMRNIFGGISGQKCYEALQKDQDGPCPFCTNHLLIDKIGPTGVHQWEYQNTRNNRWYDCRDRAIRWSDGRLVRLEIATDITDRKKNEEALLKSEHMYRLFAENVSEVIWTMNIFGEVTYVSPTVFKLRGYTAEEVMHQRLEEIITPVCLPLAYEKLKTIFEEGRQGIFKPPKLVLLEQIKKDGSTVWTENIVGLVKDETNDSILILGVTRDITERRLAEEALRKSEAKFRFLFNSQRDAVTVHKMGKDGQPTHFIQVNDVACERLGFTREEMLTLSPQDIDAPDRSGQMPAIIEELLKTKYVLFETEHIAKDGHRIPVEISAVLFQMDDSEATLSVARDISERRLAEEALRKSEENYRNIYMSAVEGIFRSTPEGRFISANPAIAHMLGYDSPDELIRVVRNISVDLFVDPEDRIRFTNALKQEVVLKNYEVKCHHKSGATIWGLLNIRIIRDDAGNVVFFEGTCQDITERKLADNFLQIQLTLIKALTTSHTTKEAFEFILDAAMSVEGLDSGGIYVVDPDTGAVDLIVHHGVSPEFVELISHFAADAPQVLQVKTGIPFYGRYKDLRQPGSDEIRDREGVTSVASIPVVHEGHLIAIMNIASHLLDDIPVHIRKLLETIAAHISGALADIHTEEALRESEERYRGLFTYITSGVVVYRVLGDGKDFIVTDFNPAAEAIEQIQRDEVIGKSVSEVFFEVHEFGLFETFQRVWRTGKPEHFPIAHYKDKRIKGWRDNFVFRLSSDIVVAVYEDLTEKKQAEEALAISEEKYRDLCENAVIGIFQTALDGTLMHANDTFARMYGFKDALEILGAGINVRRDLYERAEDRTNVSVILKEHGVMEMVELPVLKKNKSRFWVSVSARSVRDKDGTTLYYEGICIDITDKKRAEATHNLQYEIISSALHAKDLVDFYERIRVSLSRLIDVENFFVAFYDEKTDLISEIFVKDQNDHIPTWRADKSLTGLVIKQQKPLLFKKAEIPNLVDSGEIELIGMISEVWLGVPLMIGGKACGVMVVQDYENPHAYEESDLTLMEMVAREMSIYIEQKQAEDEARAYQRRLTDIIHFLPDATLAIDKEKRIIIWNKAIEEMTGIPAAEMIGKGDYAYTIPFYGEARPQLMDLVFEDDTVIPARYPTIIREGNTLIAEVFCNALYNNTGAWVFAKASPLYDSSGGIIGVIESIRDITDRKRAEEEIQFKNVLLLTQQETTLDGILIVDEAGKILQYNQKFIEIWGIPGYLLESLIDEPVLQFVMKQVIDPDAFLSRARYLYDHKEEKSFEELVLKDGRILERFSAPMQKKDSKYYGRVWYFRDITERKRIEEAYTGANKKLHLLNSFIRHDIVNQISVIELILEQVLQTEDKAKNKEYISKARETSSRIGKTIEFTQEFEGFGIVSSGWQRIYNTLESAKEEIFFGEITIENYIPTNLEIYADPIIRKVFATLMENAIRHGSVLTMIQFSVQEEEGDLIISCFDDGMGIPPEEKDLIFARGYGNHTGLGLFLAREILSITGLSIRECGVAGEGARFEIVVPPGKFRFS